MNDKIITLFELVERMYEGVPPKKIKRLSTSSVYEYHNDIEDYVHIECSNNSVRLFELNWTKMLDEQIEIIEDELLSLEDREIITALIDMSKYTITSITVTTFGNSRYLAIGTVEEGYDCTHDIKDTLFTRLIIDKEYTLKELGFEDE